MAKLEGDELQQHRNSSGSIPVSLKTGFGDYSVQKITKTGQLKTGGKGSDIFLQASAEQAPVFLLK